MVQCVWLLAVLQCVRGEMEERRERSLQWPQAPSRHKSRRQQVNGPWGLASDAGFPEGRLLRWAEDPSFPLLLPRACLSKPRGGRNEEEKRGEETRGKGEREGERNLSALLGHITQFHCQRPSTYEEPSNVSAWLKKSLFHYWWDRTYCTCKTA